MNKEQRKLTAIKDAIDERLTALYKENQGRISKEMGTLEYLMCLIEADVDSPDYAQSCLIKMYE